jgi:Cyclin M transmembrane N-terminal domain
MIHSLFVTSLLIWVGIAFCIIQSAIFSGLNLAIFSISKLRLEVEAAGGNRDAISLLGLRKDSNLTLSAVLWGNVTINVLLTLLSDSVLAGIGAFAFSTFVIMTHFCGNCIPPARSGSSLSMPRDSHVWCWMRITFCATRSSMKYLQIWRPTGTALSS